MTGNDGSHGAERSARPDGTPGAADPDVVALANRCRLAAPTPPQWTRALRAQLPAALPRLLVEQAHLEKKAAAAAVRLLFRVPVDHRAQRALSVLAREELVHFERTLRLLQDRSLSFEVQLPQPYAEALKEIAAKVMPDRLVDELLFGAVIEARSCERMSCVARALAGLDDEAAAFYLDLVEAERRHHSQYLEAAATMVVVDAACRRFAVIAAHEAAVLQRLPFEVGLHSGVANLEGVQIAAEGAS
ncbi:MAG: tRNA isopentenyl-2-thiomethyl-A-37 hydroxylase MiaE [Planctomycetota bacterium]|nr:tRNA isopentenyl-2-thiomethyl-A-37 hydroxylase MiaE [Planctomycetota bacterium]